MADPVIPLIDEYPPMTTEELDEICYGPTRVWRFARSMPKTPHWYLVRDKDNNDLFCRFVLHTRKHGVEGYFWQTPRLYFVHREFQYFTDGCPLLTLDHPTLWKDGTPLINRDLAGTRYPASNR